jgi:hypothetical protein
MEQTDALDRFFSQYPSFSYNRKASSPQEFYRIGKQFKWAKNNLGEFPPQSQVAWQNFRIAMVQTFNGTFGTDTED